MYLYFLDSSSLVLHVSKTATPTAPCGASPSAACKSIADAVKVAEASAEYNHTIIVHGENLSKVTYEVNTTIALSDNYHFTSSDGTRVVITSNNVTTIHAFRVLTASTVRFEGMDFKGIGVLSKDDQSGGTIMVKNCNIECDVTAISVKSLESIVIEGCFFNIKKPAPPRNIFAFAVRITKELKHLSLNTSVIWGNFLSASRIAIVSMDILNFELYGSWSQTYGIKCTKNCTVKIKNGIFGNCTGCTLMKIRETFDADDCSGKSAIFIENVTISHIKSRSLSVVEMECTQFQMDNVHVKNNNYEGATMTPYFFNIRMSEGNMNGVSFEKNTISNAIYFSESDVTMTNLRSVNSNEHTSFVYLTKSNLSLNHAFFTEYNMGRVFEFWYSKAVINNLTSTEKSKTACLAFVKESSLILGDTIINGTKHRKNAIDAFIQITESTVNFYNVLIENVKPEGTDPGIIIKAYGNIVMRKVTIKNCQYLNGIQLIAANVTVFQLNIVDNIGHGHFVLADPTNKENLVYSAVLTDVFVGNNNISFLEDDEIWNSLLLGYTPPKRMAFNNVSVQMDLKEIGCLKVGDSTKKFSDFVNVSCPLEYQPVKTTHPGYDCTKCGKNSSSSVKGMGSGLCITLIIGLFVVFFQNQ